MHGAHAGQVPPSTGIILAHGASGSMDTGHLPACANGLAMRGIGCVVRFTHLSPKVSNRASVYEVSVDRCEHNPISCSVHSLMLQPRITSRSEACMCIVHDSMRLHAAHGTHMLAPPAGGTPCCSIRVAGNQGHQDMGPGWALHGV